MKEYETVKVKIADVKLDKDNPNQFTPEIESRLKRSMKEFGNTQPIIIDKKTMVLADGEHRLQRYIKEGLEEIPAVLVEFKNDAHRRLYRQAANKIRGRHDENLDAQEYLKIIEAGEKELLKMATGLSITDVEKHLRKQELLTKEEDFDVEKELEEIKEPIVKKGEVWQLGSHRLMCGDSTKSEDVGLLMSDDKADMVFTDPPYGVDYAKLNESYIESKNRVQGTKQKKKWEDIKGDELRGKGLKELLVKSINIIKISSVENYSVYMCFGARSTFCLFEILDEMKINYAIPIVWYKGRFTPSWHRYHPDYEMIAYFGPGSLPTGKKSRWYGPNNETTQWNLKTDINQEYKHPTQKPIELSLRAINNSSQEGMIVLDLFGGSGSTLIACEKLQRKCYMMEIDPIYCDVIIKRWEKFTGGKAEKLV